MAVGASKPTVVTDKDGFFSVKSKMLVSLFLYFDAQMMLSMLTSC